VVTQLEAFLNPLRVHGKVIRSYINEYKYKKERDLDE
jgi:hypothetical protein